MLNQTLPAFALLCTMPLVCSAQQQTSVRLTLTQEVRVDGNAQNLLPIPLVAAQRDGTLLIWQPRDAKMLRFDKDGAPTGHLGGRGAGPGEFRSLGNFGWVADSLWVIDVVQRRTTFYSPAGALLRTVPWPTEVVTPQGEKIATPVGAAPGAIFGDNSFMLLSPVNLPSTLGLAATRGSPETQYYVVVSPAGQLKRVIGRAPANLEVPECVVAWNAGAQLGGAYPRPFCAHDIVALARDGGIMVQVRQSNATGDAGTFHLIVLSLRTGDTLAAATKLYRPTPVEPSVADSAIRAMNPQAPGRPMPPREAVAAYQKVSAAKTYPAVEAVMVGADSSIWLAMPAGSAARTRWRVLDRGGRDVGVLELPPRTRLMSATLSSAIAVELDEDDVPSVVRFKVGRARR